MDTVFADGKYSYNDDQGILILTDNSRRYHDLRKEMMVEKYGYDENDNMQGLFIDGETAVVRFDSFITNMLDDQLYIYTENSIPYLFDYSTNVGFDNCFYWIYTTHPEIKNVVIDLSCNGGGSVNAVPYVAAFFTGDPYFYNVDALTGNAFEWHYEIDFNRDGTFNRNWDSFENYYNFYLLVSDVSASSSNRLAAFAKNAGVKIIGKRDFGGGCGMVTYADACGFVFNASEARLCLYKDNDGNLVSSDHGVPVDYELDPEYWYDFEKLNAFLASLNA